MIPKSFDQKNEGKLWVAEKAICEDFSNLISRKNPRREIAEYIAAYVGKWAPFEFREVMEVYFKHVPDLKESIMLTYN